MSRFSAYASAFLLVMAGVGTAAAQDAGVAEEVRGLRQLIEKQSRQIDALAEQLAKLRIALEKNGEIALGSANVAPAGATMPPPAPVEAAAKPEFSTDVPKAEPADGRRHVVIKGETLTSIAKHYNITLAELKKANKEVDERKLQIGQTLTVPQAKAAEAPATPAKKEE